MANCASTGCYTTAGTCADDCAAATVKKTGGSCGGCGANGATGTCSYASNTCDSSTHTNCQSITCSASNYKCTVDSGGTWQWRTTPPAEVCTDGYDNDCDGLTDCADPDCAGATGPGGVKCCQSAANCIQDDCVVESCVSNVCLYANRSAGATDECGTCQACDTSGGNCAGISAISGKNCDDDCTYCSSTSGCVNVAQCQVSPYNECTGQAKCDAAGGNCAEPDASSTVCSTCYTKSWFASVTPGTGNYPNCCGDDSTSDSFWYWDSGANICRYCESGVSKTDSAPTAASQTISPAPPTWTNATSTITVSATVSDVDGDTAQILVYKDAAKTGLLCTGNSVSSGSTSSCSFTASARGCADGTGCTVYIFVKETAADDTCGQKKLSSTAVTTSFNYDATIPTVSITSPTANANVMSTVAISVNANDATSGVYIVEAFLQIESPTGSGTYIKVNPTTCETGAAANNLIGSDTTSPYSINWDSTKCADSKYKITAIAWDGGSAGPKLNSNSASVIVTADNTAPATTITLSGTQVPGKPPEWYISPVTVSLSCSDAMSGCAQIKYRVKNTVTNAYTCGGVSGCTDPAGTTIAATITPNTFTISQDGKYIIEVQSKDASGNWENWHG